MFKWDKIPVFDPDKNVKNKSYQNIVCCYSNNICPWTTSADFMKTHRFRAILAQVHSFEFAHDLYNFLYDQFFLLGYCCINKKLPTFGSWNCDRFSCHSDTRTNWTKLRHQPKWNNSNNSSRSIMARYVRNVINSLKKYIFYTFWQLQAAYLHYWR